MVCQGRKAGPEVSRPAILKQEPPYATAFFTPSFADLTLLRVLPTLMTFSYSLRPPHHNSIDPPLDQPKRRARKSTHTVDYTSSP